MARVKFTAGRLAVFLCPKPKTQAFLWDATAPGLALRVTANGARAFVFQSKIDGIALRMTIGNPDVWRIPEVQAEARRLQQLIDAGRDPRTEKAATEKANQETRATAKVERLRADVIGLDAWRVYCQARTGAWGARSLADHVAFAAPGGDRRKRGVGVKMDGALHSLLRLPLAQIDAKAVQSWATREAKTRATSARLGFRLLRAFLNWCAEHPAYRDIAQPHACRAKETRERLGKGNAKNDALQRQQLKAWFSEVQKANNPSVGAYLQTLLLAGPRPEELRGLRWKDVDFQWKAISIRDKVEGTRQIPLTPFVAHLLGNLPHRNAWVFSSPSTASKDGRIAAVREPHVKALVAAGLPHVSLHGLRRSFGSLSEWVECPVGIVAQIQGHKPSAVAEKHYRVRPLDLLRMWHEKIEVWILQEADITFDPKAGASRIREAA